MKQRTSLAALLLALLFPLAAGAQERAERPLITVTGEAEMRVVPDEVYFDVSVQAFNRDLKAAKAQVDGRLTNLVEMTRRHGVAARDVQTDYVSVSPRYRGGSDVRQLLGYSVRKDLAFTLRDVSRAEALLSELMESDVTRVNAIDFRTSQLRKHRDEARAMAIRAAQEKAVALTKELGQRIGKAYSIEEVAPSAGPMSQHALAQNVSRSVGDGEDSSGTLALGQIRISARVVVRFELQ